MIMQMHSLRNLLNVVFDTVVFDTDIKRTNYKTLTFKGTIMQTEKALLAYVFEKYPEISHSNYL